MEASRDRGAARTATGRTCAHCGATADSDLRFCGGCGARLTHPNRAPEYKHVTVLFADVVRSMEVAAALDIERLREVMTDLVEHSARIARGYGGGTVEYTGDGLMVVFGAPVAMEDHALRACLAALSIQEHVRALAAEVLRIDGVEIRIRVGLNSGRVIAGDFGAGSLGYRATGETVGFAQRMEAAARPGGVLLSESTARLVEHVATLAEPEWVHVKGAADPVPARNLLSIGPRDASAPRTEARLVGRVREMAILVAALEEAIESRGSVVNVVGEPGVGKSRLAREFAALAADRGADVYWGFCESHARDVPFHAVTRLLRATSEVLGLNAADARETVRRQIPDATERDLLLLDDLLGIADPNVSLPQMSSEARRRGLTDVISRRALGRHRPAVFVVEDAHWIDAVSESMLADFLAVIPRTSSMVLITSRPEYDGTLLRIHDAEPICLGALNDSDVSTLLGELLGTDPSVGGLPTVIAERAAGNPFFVEEMVRELAQRGVLTGAHGNYTCRADVAEVTVPGTIAAVIDARIDRLSPDARRTLSAASVIGNHFESDLLCAMGFDGTFDDLLNAELIDRLDVGSGTEYAFRHPLIRTVAYESQLTPDRAEWHRRVAAAIEERAPEAVEENAAQIAEHLQAAGALAAAYRWHMRAGAWSANRDLAAARLSWERARRIADGVPHDADATSMRIAPRTMLCATDWQARDVQESGSRFEELRHLCEASGDSASLAIAMTGPATELLYAGRIFDGARLVSEQMAMLESIGDPGPIMGVAAIAFCNWLGVLAFDEILQWSQNIVDLAAGDPEKGAGFGVGSPLAIAMAWRGTSRCFLGRSNWRDDLHHAVAMARRSNSETLSGVIAWTYGIAMQYGTLRSSDSVVDASEHAVRIARAASSDRAEGLATYTLAVALLTGDDTAERGRGLELMMTARDIWLRKKAMFLIPVTDVWAARASAARGDGDAAIEAMRLAVDALRQVFPFYSVWAVGVLVETLLQRAAAGDLAEADRLTADLAGAWPGGDSVLRDITVSRLRTLISRARGDESYRDDLDRYHAVAKALEFDGHVAWAECMVNERH